MAKRLRLDAELVRRGLVSSRSLARSAVEEGKVLVGGLPATKIDALVSPDMAIALAGPPARYVSRGGDKLAGAIERLDVAVAGKAWLDAGASTGGFTDCLLQNGATRVLAVDVGYGQFDWGLRNDERVTVIERMNVRNLTSTDLPFVADGVTADLSFISLRTVLDSLVASASEKADFILLVKPQFEVGRSAVGKGGVVREPEKWESALTGVVDRGTELGLGLLGAIPSPLRGPAGNVEFFVQLRRGPSVADDGAIAAAVQEVGS